MTSHMITQLRVFVETSVANGTKEFIVSCVVFVHADYVIFHNCTSFENGSTLFTCFRSTFVVSRVIMISKLCIIREFFITLNAMVT